MPQHDQGDKKRRLHHEDLADAEMTVEEKQRERQRRWLANEKRDPIRAQEIREKNTANKRAWRKRKKEEKEKAEQTGDAEVQDQGPRKRQRVSSHETNPVAERSDSAPVDIPIDPVLLNEENVATRPTPRIMLDAEVMTVVPEPINPTSSSRKSLKPPPLMRDVEVMTVIPEHINPTSSSPESSQQPSSPNPSVPTNLDSRDLATPIIGSQVHEKSETITWSDGSITVLPCIVRDGVNVCQEDATTVSYFATLPESLPETSKNVVHLKYSDWRTKSRQLCDEISAAIRVNKAVVIRNISRPEPATLDLDYLEDRGMSDLMRVVVHGESVFNSHLHYTI